MTVSQAVQYTKRQLDPIAEEESLQQAKILVAYTIGIDEDTLPIHAQMEMTREQLSELASYIVRREKHEPLQYIIGQWSFMGLPFLTDSRALIPRQDTETLAECALQIASENDMHTVLDLCCGSGCIGISLAKLGGLIVTCADVSKDCIELTRENAALNETDVQTACGDLFSAVSQQYDLIVCNPPYLSSSEMKQMQPELQFEPSAALDGGADGLDFYREIARQYRRFLSLNGLLLLEIGATQAKAVCELFSNAEIRCDICGHPRVAIIRN